MVTIFATWDKRNKRWKFRDCVALGSKGTARRRRHYKQLPKAFIKVPEDAVLGVKRHKLASAFIRGRGNHAKSKKR